MTFAWPIVEFAGDVITLFLINILHANSLWYVLTQQAVEVLVGASLPRMIRGGEVALEVELLLQLCIVVELGSVVQAERLEATLVPGNGELGGTNHFLFGARLELHDDSKATDPFDQGKETVAQVFADDCIS